MRLSDDDGLSIIMRSTMHAFDFILVLFSFVYAAAVTHVLSTAGEDHHRLRLGLYTRSPARRFREPVRPWNSNA